jgi:hypothetical protein
VEAVAEEASAAETPEEQEAAEREAPVLQMG